VARLTWSKIEDRQFETGLDRGVLYPKNGSAVPWNGLTGVEEEGGESSEAYYIDGRPFLFLPKPKEFSATLTAYTYPEEFSEIMGVAEAEAGMYLDSQMGDMFDLSYRTLIANSVDETGFGYKIHLIYNATVAPPGSSYETLSDDVNPSEFSWEIAAVPVPIEGFRPTAHVMIDTRHADADKLSEFEALLYGDDNNPASIPDPSTILEILGYGDSIEITDNEDGTWTAVGSLHNVHIIGDDIFEINNVTATDHGDGTYDVSSTS